MRRDIDRVYGTAHAFVAYHALDLLAVGLDRDGLVAKRVRRLIWAKAGRRADCVHECVRQCNNILRLVSSCVIVSAGADADVVVGYVSFIGVAWYTAARW